MERNISAVFEGTRTEHDKLEGQTEKLLIYKGLKLERWKNLKGSDKYGKTREERNDYRMKEKYQN